MFQEAILNTYFMSPPRIYRWEQMIFNPEYEGESFMNLGDKCDLKENYFDDDSIVLLESMQDGVLYSNILLKLYLKSLKHGGLSLIHIFHLIRRSEINRYPKSGN